MTRPKPLWLTIGQFCELCGISRNTFYRWESAGVIPEGAVTRKRGMQPRVDAHAAMPERFEEGEEE